ncbi:MAG: hypothetical protein HY866_16525 [Chloroflexi bacterium]|nr:hypothetical protein [Chloroflexota bacterium]
MADLVLSLVIWVLVITSIRRGLRQSKPVDRYALLTWTIFISIAIAVSMRVESLAAVINRPFGGRPAAHWLSVTFSLNVAVCYALSLHILARDRQIPRQSEKLHLALIYCAPLVFVLMVLVMALRLAGQITVLSTFYMLRWLLEVYALPLIVRVFIPINTWLFRHELVAPMRVRHLAMLVFCWTCAASAVLAILFIPPILLTGVDNPLPSLVPRAMVAGGCLFVILIPHHWMIRLSLPLQLYRYFRVAAFESYLQRQVFFEREPFRWRHILRPQYVEGMTYVSVINLLDHYEELKPHDPWRQRIEKLLLQYSNYDDLIKALGSVNR